MNRWIDGSQKDGLTYIYENGNQLTKVTDSQGSEGFNNGSSGDYTDYYYDGAGNATSDANRGIGNGGLKYNILNLPSEISVNSKTVSYNYDATGSKLRMRNNMENTKYAGAFEYDNSNYLTRIATEEGQISIINNGANISDYSFEYYLRDHLGNTRMVLTEAGAIVQETEYMPFGLAIPRTAGTNKYNFLGKETQPETGLLDYGARQYDASIGRWMVVDPLTDEQEAWSPYHYSYNSPVNYADLYGLSPSSALESNAIAICPTCPSDKKYDEYRDSKSLYTYDKGTGFVLNGDGKGATIYGQRNQESTFSGWEHAIGLGVGLPAVEIPKKWLGKATVGAASKVTTPISYLTNKLAESQRLQGRLGYKNVMSKRLFTHTRMINGQMVRFRTNLLGRYVGRWLGFGLARASMAITVYDIVDTANTNFQNMSLTDQTQLLQTGQMSGSFIPDELIQQQRENVKSHFDNE